ncbi:MAG: hypothetical protein MI867_16245 [Pseudomonadales bacterium]|nr:hypothetical protein [Pseudomonadales bacterium]
MKDFKLTGQTVDLSKTATLPDKPVKDSRGKIKDLQLELLRQHLAFYKEKHRAIIVFEGTDASGKGGAIRRLTRHLDPRSAHVWPIGAPDAHEKQHHYLQRFWKKLPTHGEITIFDRSWYGRVLVERVENFCDEDAWKRAYREINEFERQLADDGVMIIKVFFHLSKETQRQRLVDRIQEPTKRWKITVSDLVSRQYWDKYQAAYQDMLTNTATEVAPWHVIPADDKASARYYTLKIVSDILAKHVDTAKVSLLAPDVAAMVMEQFGPEVFQTEKD